ncbi:hypothetical protein [Methanosarcina mazei]|jgi:hypothetical protein|uniref:hypothetical protein n=1 Tax=Methanosarcina mazei TaxID=2209 RepID=UPI000A3FDCDA|nr:hypothetical protein [Methanosarcina mazei]
MMQIEAIKNVNKSGNKAELVDIKKYSDYATTCKVRFIPHSSITAGIKRDKKI